MRPFGPQLILRAPEGDPAGGAPPAAAPPAAAPAAAVPAAVPAATLANEPPFLRDRLERERRATLKKLGIKVPKDSDPNAAIEKFKEGKALKKDEREKLKARVKELETQASSSATATSALKVYAEAALADLPEATQKAIKLAAGDDPAEILKTISVVKLSAPAAPPAAAAPAAGAPAAAAPPQIAAPATTTPAGTAPAPGVAGAQEDVKATHARLKASNPFAAAQYAMQHQDELLGPRA